MKRFLGLSAAQIRIEAPKDVNLEMLSRRAALSGNCLLLLRT